MKHKARAAILICVALWLAAPATAQYTGHNILGDFGLNSGSQSPLPGFYAGYMYYNYDTDTVKGTDGGALPGSGTRKVSLNLHAVVTNWVLPKKILGANIGGMAAFPWLNGIIESPFLEATGSYGFTDLYVQPINLGWKTKHVDIIASYGFFAPTGKYEPGSALGNRGKGFWSHELSLGGTVYFDEKRTWNVSTRGFFEMHTEREGGDVKVGDILTLEGGFAKTIKQIINVGPVYYAQWKVNADSGSGVPLLFQNNKHRVYGVGPEFNIFLPTKLDGQVPKSGISASVRYLWETGAVMKSQGNTLVVSLTYMF